MSSDVRGPSAGRRAAAWLPAALYMALIWTLSSFSFDAPIEHIPLRDKGVHFLEYGTLGFLLAHATFRSWPSRHLLRTAALAVCITVLWGWLDEIHQAFVPGRSSDALDLVADTAGALAGVSARAILRWLPRLRSPKTPARST